MSLQKSLRDTNSVASLQLSRNTRKPQDLTSKAATERKTDPALSPAKGILLTPGTGVTRRKTVSFGASTIDTKSKQNEGAKHSEVLKIASDTSPTLWKPENAHSHQRRQTSLTKTLLKARSDALEHGLGKQATVEGGSKDEQFGYNQEAQRVCTGMEEEHPAPDPDITIDLNEPRSNSGRHWKAEYEQYNRTSKRELKKVIQRNQVTKSYAEKKDSEAVDLREQLKRQLHKVATMEKKVSRLVAQLASAEIHGPNDEQEQSKLVCELAQRTASAFRYQQKADKCRLAIQKQSSIMASEDDRGVNVSVRESEEAPLVQSINSQEIRDQLTELEFLRTEINSFRENVKTAEEKAAKLECENLALQSQLAKAKDDMKIYETRCQARADKLSETETDLHKGDPACDTRPGQVTVQNRKVLCVSDVTLETVESEGLQAINIKQGNNKSRDQNVELASLQPRSTPYRKASETLIEGLGMETPTSKPKVSQTQHRKQKLPISFQELWELQGEPPRRQVHGREMLAEPSNEKSKCLGNSGLQDVQKTTFQKPSLDIWTMRDGEESINGSAVQVMPLPRKKVNDLIPTQSNARPMDTSRDISQNFSLDQQLPKQGSSAGSQKTTAVNGLLDGGRAMDSLVSPALPSPEPSIWSAAKRTRERKAKMYSPRPSMLSFPSSPAKANSSDARGFVARGIGERRSANLLTAGGRGNTALPPERAAAAKARLEKKNAEKRKTRDVDKENA